MSFSEWERVSERFANWLLDWLSACFMFLIDIITSFHFIHSSGSFLLSVWCYQTYSSAQNWSSCCGQWQKLTWSRRNVHGRYYLYCLYTVVFLTTFGTRSLSVVCLQLNILRYRTLLFVHVQRTCRCLVFFICSQYTVKWIFNN